MTSLSNLFSTYTPCSRHQKVKITNKSFSFVVGKATIVLSNNLLLKLVLNVPNLSCNLIFINKLTCHLNCGAKFSQTDHIFQELCSGKRISSARELGGLFILGKEAEKIPKALQCESSFNHENVL